MHLFNHKSTCNLLCDVIRSDNHKTLCNITCYYTALEHAAIASSSHHINERLTLHCINIYYVHINMY